MPDVRFHDVRFGYEGREPVLDGVTLHLGEGWTGIVGPNGAGKTTLLRLAVGELAPTGGHVARPAACVLCEQRVDEAGPDVRALAASTDRVATRWTRRLGLDPDQLDRWTTLSAGERKRWQLAGALAAEPDVLALDEPTNHLDETARGVVIEALRRFRGVGLVVSHDRALLDALTRRTVRVDGGVTAYDGGWSAARALWEAEAETRRSTWAAADADRKRAKRQLADARRVQESAARAVHASARMRGPRDSDGRSMGAKNLASWAAAGAGRAVSRHRHHLERAEAAAEALAIERSRGRAVFLDWEPPPKRVLATLEGPLLAGSRVLAREVRVAVARDTRVHVVGDNGAGKSTLLAALVAASTVPERLLYLPQEVRADEGAALAREVGALPPDERGRVGQLAAALGLDPARAWASGQPSPGEVRKLALALGLARRVWLVVLDEPTNHLDLPSIERLQDALQGYPGALVIASHDAVFASAVTSERWRVGGGAVLSG